MATLQKRRAQNHRWGARGAHLELKKRYGQGASIRELAAETGRSYGFIHRVLVESDVTLRGRGGPGQARRTDCRFGGPESVGPGVTFCAPESFAP